MISFLLFAILVVLIFGFWGEAAFGLLIILGIGALAIIALIVVLIVSGVSIGGIVALWNYNIVPFWNSHVVTLWNANVVPFWNANAELIVPPLATIIGVPLWIYLAFKVFKHIRYSIATYSIANDSTLEKAVFFVVGMPVIIVWLLVISGLFVAPVIYLFLEMQKWLVVVSAT